MVKITVKHDVAGDERAHWMADFERKKVIRELYGISRGTDPVVYEDAQGEIVVVHHINDKVSDAVKAMDHIQASKASRRQDKAKANPVFSE